MLQGSLVVGVVVGVHTFTISRSALITQVLETPIKCIIALIMLQSRVTQRVGSQRSRPIGCWMLVHNIEPQSKDPQFHSISRYSSAHEIYVRTNTGTASRQEGQGRKVEERVRAIYVTLSEIRGEGDSTAVWS